MELFNTASAELSFVASATLGLPYSIDALQQLLNALIEARLGNAAMRPDGSDLLRSLKLDSETSREVTLRKFRMQATRAARETVYYGELFQRLGLDPARLNHEDIPRIPVTTKDAIRDHPYDFVCRSAKVALIATTTGTTGKHTRVCFSAEEMEVFMLLCAINNLMIADFVPDDVVLLSAASRATLGNLTAFGCVGLTGATVVHGGQAEHEETLTMLAEARPIPGKRSRVSVLQAYPSYLGELVEVGLQMGFGPSNFALKRIDTGGEIVTKGLKERAKQLFGPVSYYEGYGMTETWGTGAELCPEGHLHYGTSSGLWEFLNPETGAPAQPGEVATLVATPLPPARETTLLLRYDTRDLVRMLSEPPTCSAKQLPATTNLLGKMRLCVQHDGGWTFPRDVVEALEALEAVPLPARFGFWAVEGGVAVEVVARGEHSATQQTIRDSLEARGSPVKELHIRASRTELVHPYPLRCDLREITRFQGPEKPGGSQPS